MSKKQTMIKHQEAVVKYFNIIINSAPNIEDAIRCEVEYYCNYNNYVLDKEQLVKYCIDNFLEDCLNIYMDRMENEEDNYLNCKLIAYDCVEDFGIFDKLTTFINNNITNITIDEIKTTKKVQLSESIKKQVAGKQKFKCANKPNSNLKYLSDYKCPMWNDDGCFDEAGYEIDHIIEQSIGGTDDMSNLQALCQSCHKLKTKRFLNNKGK